MTNQEVETKVAQAFEGIVPDIQEKILDRCFEQEGNVVPLTLNNKTKYRKLRTYAAYAAGIAAGLMLMIGGLSGIRMYRANYIVDSTVSLDVNPSVEIKVNQKAVVLEVVPRNEDAEIIIGDMDFKGSSLEITLNALVGSMLKNGYLNEIANSILVSIDGGDDEHSLELQAKIAEDIEKTLLAQEFNAAVLCQTIKPTDELKELAEAHDVSVGKAQLIQDIANQSEEYTFEDLATLSINELSLLTESTEVDLENVSSVGNASTKAYIEESIAIDAVLLAAGLDGISENDVEDFECELEFENGKMVYEVEFIYNDNQYEYDIDALTGELINSEIKPVEKPEPTAAPTATPEPTATHTPTPTPEPTATSTPTPTNTPTPEPTATNTPVPTNTPTPEPIVTPDAEPSGKPGKDPKPSESPRPGETPTFLTEEQVKEIVLNHLALAADLIDDFEIRLENNKNNHFYMIKFEFGDVDYTFKIDAVTGEITEENSKPDDENPEDKEHPHLPGWPTDYEFPTTEELKEMVLAHAAVAEDVVDDFEVRFVRNKNNMFFLIKFEVNDTDYTYKIDALTGEIVVSDSETDENDEEDDEKEDETPENPWGNWEDWFNKENWSDWFHEENWNDWFDEEDRDDWFGEETPEHWGNWEDWQNWEGWHDIKPEDWTKPENWPQFPELTPGGNPSDDEDESDDDLDDDDLDDNDDNENPWGDWNNWEDWFNREDDDKDDDDGEADEAPETPWVDWNDWFDREEDDEDEDTESEDDEDDVDEEESEDDEESRPYNNGNKNNGNRNNRN